MTDGLKALVSLLTQCGYTIVAVNETNNTILADLGRTRRLFTPLDNGGWIESGFSITPDEGTHDEWRDLNDQ